MTEVIILAWKGILVLPSFSSMSITLEITVLAQFNNLRAIKTYFLS